MAAPLRVLLALLALAVIGWTLATAALWLHLQRQAHDDRQWHQQGHSQLQFPLTRASDLIGNRALDVRQQRFDQRGLLLQFGPGAANVPIGFDGRCLHTGRFPMLQLTLDASADLVLALVHSPLAGGPQRVSELALPAGRQQLRLDLRDLDWRDRSVSESERQPLGDANGRLCEFRLVPVADQPVQLTLADLHFTQPADAEPELAWADAVAVSVRLQRPESVLIARDRLRQHADLEIWPGTVPADNEDGETTDLRWLGYLALACTLGGAALARRARVPSLWLALAGPVLLLAGNRIGPSSGPLEGLVILGCALTLGICYRSLSADQRHWRWVGDAAAWRSALIGTGLVLLSALLVHWLSDAPLRRLPQPTDLLRYLLWAALQQTLLQRVLIPSLNRARTGICAGLPAAAAFALLHAPNLSLMALCLLAGLWWSSHYRQHRSWLPLVVVHLILGATLTVLLPQDWLYSAEIGERYFTAPPG